MRILFLTQVLPYPLDAGPKVRAYYTLRYLAQHHEITLVSFMRPNDTDEALHHLATFCRHVHVVPMSRSRVLDAKHLILSLISNQPFLIVRDRSSALTNRLENILRSSHPFDAIHADQLWMAPYALWAKRKVAGTDPIIVLDQHNAVYQIPKRLAERERNPVKRALLKLEAAKLAHYETTTCRKFNHVVWVTQEDRDAIESHARQFDTELDNSIVIPISVDPSLDRPLARQLASHRVTFLGGLHWPPNADGILWYAREVWPIVIKAVPHAILTVIGKAPPAELLSLCSVVKNIDVVGYIEDPTPYLSETAVSIVPLHAGGGMRVKILDAWKWGLPVVSTTIGAEGIKIRPDNNICIADSADCFAQATIRLLSNPLTAQRVAKAGRQTLEQEYSWNTTYTKWDQIYPV